MAIRRKVFFNLSFDDVHPESSSDGTDCCGDRERGVFKYFLELWKLYPELKITIFVTPNWIDRANDHFPIRQFKCALGMKYTNSWNGEPFLLTKHKEWCEWLNSYPNLEVAIHGYSHHADSMLHSQEFEYMHHDACKLRLEMAERIFKESGLHYVRGFRPPGWGISDGLFEALSELKYEFISLDSIACKIDNLSRYNVDKYRGLVNVPQNWDIAHGTIDEALEIAQKHGLLMAKGHISNYYDGDKIGNGLNEITFERICGILERLRADVSFVSMVELSRMSG